ncbi:hypothetical protein LEP1GSC068_3731 [Leptospira sp. Fiocruz LV3954]|nr:hypothetical protein LEP1GSC068_3731 [Leptospira sp. Fiocruz LV3954]
MYNWNVILTLEMSEPHILFLRKNDVFRKFLTPNSRYLNLFRQTYPTKKELKFL